MFLLLALLFAVAGLVHARLRRRDLAGRIELVLVYLIAGYHGVVMLAMALWALLFSERAAAWLGAEVGNPFQAFFGFAYLGMSVASILAIWLRGNHLVGQVVAWSLYFFGATWVHFAEFGSHDHGVDLLIATKIILLHALVPVVMLGLLAWRWKLIRPRLGTS